MTLEIQKAEREAREALDKLRSAYDGWPATEAQWEFLAKAAADLNSACELRKGLLVIEQTA